MQSVKNFAIRNKYEYRIIDKIPDWYKLNHNYWNLRTLSEWMRLDILSTEKYSLVVDWDIELLENFDVPNDLTFIPSYLDSMVYNHDNIEFFRSALKTLKNKDRNDNRHQLVLYNGIVNVLRKEIINYRTFKNYIHHSESNNQLLCGN